MDDARIGRALRVLRQRRGLRQAEVAAAAGVSQSTISDIEAGRLARLPVATIRRVFAAVDAGFEGIVHWRGAGLDRLLDARHAALVAASVRRLTALGWETRVETTYSVYGERGSVDVLGALARVRAVLVEEVKSELANLEETIRKLDEKVRLVRKEIAEDEFGWQPASVGRLLVLPDSTVARRRVAKLDPVLRVAFPDRGSVVRQWLRAPSGALAGILFQPDIAMGDKKSDRRGVQHFGGRRNPDSRPEYR
jgi:transcriptional regulator with XRE-family HTH domain